MSMYRQLWLSILLSVLVGLGASLFAALINARGYLEAQLSMKNRDNAATLALGISQAKPEIDDVIIAVTAQYNSGQYEAIRVIDPEGKVLIEKTAPEERIDVPGWFMRWLPIRPEPGLARISSGWNEVGTLTLLSHSHFAYVALWDSARYLTLSILGAGLVCWGLVVLALLRLRKPMQAVVEQARSISKRCFVTIPEPDVPELKQLARAMNSSVERICAMLEEDAREYEALRRVTNYDPLTGLANRGFFFANLDTSLNADEATCATLALIRLASLDDINRSQGREATDQFLQAFSAYLNGLCERYPDSLAARLNGGDFACLITTTDDPAPLLAGALTDIQRLIEPFGVIHAQVRIGYARLLPGEKRATLMARVDAALAQAEATGVNCAREAPQAADANLPCTAEQWRQTLREVLRDKRSLKLVHHAIRGQGDVPELDECPLRIRVEGGDDWLPPGPFLAQAERLGMIQELDLATIDLAFEALHARPDLSGIWVNISARSVSHPGFREQLLERLEAQGEMSRRLWLEVPETGALRRIEDLRSLIGSLKSVGCHIGLEHYGLHFDQVGQLYELGLDFLKVDASFVRGIDSNPGNQAFLSGLRDITQKIGIRLYAEGVETEAELRKLESLGFDGVTGALLNPA
jgi:predicted signal transduction protein with EAL and GGDEF domain